MKIKLVDESVSFFNRHQHQRFDINVSQKFGHGILLYLWLRVFIILEPSSLIKKCLPAINNSELQLIKARTTFNLRQWY